eukprot:1158244-Pelagomonas_calceolata.AAC.5
MPCHAMQCPVSNRWAMVLGFYVCSDISGLRDLRAIIRLSFAAAGKAVYFILFGCHNNSVFWGQNPDDW